MAKYVVYLSANASATVHVDVEPVLDEDGEIDEVETHERAIEEAFAVGPRDVCAQCSGWGQKAWSLDLSEFEPDDDNPVEAEADD